MNDITAKIENVLSAAFNSSPHKVVDGQEVAEVAGGPASYIYIPDVLFTQPSMEFEEQQGLKGLSHQYVLPPGLSPQKLQEYTFLFCDDLNALSEVWKFLKKNNPDTLGCLKFDANNIKKDLFDAIIGVASAFLSQDIQSWLKTGRCLDSKTQALFDEIEERVGWPGLRWTPSFETLDTIKQQIGSKKQSAKPALAPTPRMRT